MPCAPRFRGNAAWRPASNTREEREETRCVVSETFRGGGAWDWLSRSAGARGQWVEKKTLTIDGAQQGRSRPPLAEAKKRNTTGVIAVVDDGGNLMAVERIDGTFAAGGMISIGKARTAALFKKPTSFFEDLINKGRTAMTTVDDFTPLQGGVPIIVDGAIVGAVGVSGAASAEEDEELAMAGAAAALTAPAAQGQLLRQRQVSDAFAKGAVALRPGERLHGARQPPRRSRARRRSTPRTPTSSTCSTARRRSSPAARWSTAKTTAPDEIRGSGDHRAARPGSSQKGDVVIVPDGTPHWFQKVPGAFTYYVVKVR